MKRYLRQSLLQLGAILLLFASSLVYVSCTKSSAGASHTARKLHFSYAFTVRNIPPGTDSIDIWAPVPQSDYHQTISNLQVDCKYPYSIVSDEEYGNSLLRINAKSAIPSNLSATMEFQLIRSGYRALGQKQNQPQQISMKTLQRFLSPDRLVPTDGKIANETRKVVREDMTPLLKARAIYDYVASTMKYDKSGKGWGRGDALYACDIRRGNCTDFHSLFIGMARASGIPARFVIGFPIPEALAEGEIAGYHCWAEFYVDGLGWIPVDASEANKHREKWDFYFGGIDENRVQFSSGRDIRIDHASSGERVNYLIYPYVMIDGKPYDSVQTRIRFSESVE